MRKATLKFLERLFSAEINGEPARYENNKISRAAIEDGFAEEVYFDIPADKSCPFQMRVIGLALTHRGRIAYCQWAATQHEPEEIGL